MGEVHHPTFRRSVNRRATTDTHGRRPAELHSVLAEERGRQPGGDGDLIGASPLLPRERLVVGYVDQFGPRRLDRGRTGDPGPLHRACAQASRIMYGPLPSIRELKEGAAFAASRATPKFKRPRHLRDAGLSAGMLYLVHSAIFRRRVGGAMRRYCRWSPSFSKPAKSTLTVARPCVPLATARAPAYVHAEGQRWSTR